MLRKFIGVSFYFIGLGLWVLLFSVAAFWIIPWGVLFFLAGYLTKTHEWPELKHFGAWEWLRQKYFNFQVVKGTLPDNVKGRVIYAIYPHGHFSLTAIFYWALNPKFANARAAIHSAIFYLPVVGSLVRWIGAISVDEDEMCRTLETQNTPIFMCPGGVSEIELTGLDVIHRRGFLRVAHKTQSIVVPVWCPDERSYYQQYLPLGRTFSNLFFFPVPLFLWGLWWCPLLPRRLEHSRILVGNGIATLDKPLEMVEREFWEELIRLQNIKSS